VIDIHVHILPGIDDGPETWEESLEMARMAVAEGVRTLVATPHLFRHRAVDLNALNPPAKILETLADFRERLTEAKIELEVLPGCEVPLCPEATRLLEEGQILTINDARRYLSLEMPDHVIPAITEEICFQFTAQGIIPIITHPERNQIFYQQPERLKRLLHLGCLAQITAQSLTGGFGRGVAKFTRYLLSQGYVHLVASDAHNSGRRPPQLKAALKLLTKALGQHRAWDLVSTVPEKIVRGEPVY